MAEWRSKKRGKKHADNLWSKYRLRPEDYDALVEAHPVCPICEEESEYLLQVDHNHDTGVVRGLLCWRCNRGLGFFRDNPEFLESAISYLHENGGS